MPPTLCEAPQGWGRGVESLSMDCAGCNSAGESLVAHVLGWN